MINPPTNAITVKMIVEGLEENFLNKYKKHEVKLLLKNDLKYSYKKGRSTTFGGSTYKNQILKKIFALRLWTQIYNKNYIINIDEAAFN